MTPRAGGEAPRISVVVPTYNRPIALQRCVASITRQAAPPPFEIVVVDDGGAPAVEHEAFGPIPNLVVVRQPHAGAAAARMTGVTRARGGILAFVDDDCTVPEDYLASIERLFHEHPQTRVAQVRILNPEPGNRYGRLWNFNLERLLEANLSQGRDGRALSGTLGGVMVARRDVFERVAYDPQLNVGLEDADLRYQLHVSGIEVHYAPQIRVYHHVPDTLAGYLGQFIRYGRGAVHLRSKWGAVPSPFRFCTLTAPGDFRTLVRAEGLRGGTALYGALWLRRAALVLGDAYERASRLLAGEGASPGNRRVSPRSEATVIAKPAVSVIVLSYQARSRIDRPLRSLRAQDLAEPHEVIVVDSGQDGCADYVSKAYPEVRLVRSAHRLLPGAARNAGIKVARGPYVAFLADDMAVRPDWLRRRVAKHRAGFRAVGGAVMNGTPFHPVGAADYYLEYSTVVPSDRVLAAQGIPHGLSYDRDLFDQLGIFPEDVSTGEDTLFNSRCLRAGIPIGFDARVRMAHANHVRLPGFLRHHYEHGRGLVQTFERDGLTREIGLGDPRLVRRAVRIFVIYPAVRWLIGLTSIGRGRPWALPGYLVLTPLLAAGLFAAAAGAWVEDRARAHR